MEAQYVPPHAISLSERPYYGDFRISAPELPGVTSALKIKMDAGQPRAPPYDEFPREIGDYADS